MNYEEFEDIRTKINKPNPEIGVNSNGEIFGVTSDKLFEYMKDRVRNADWDYHYSDDASVRAKGEVEIPEIRNEMKLFANTLHEGKPFSDWYATKQFGARDSITVQFDLTEKELNHIKQQFKNIGAEKAFTPDLIADLKGGVPEKQQPYQFDNNGDKAEVLLHLKKSDKNNLYFLNKFDMTVTKKNHSNNIKETFDTPYKVNVNLKPGEKKLSNLNRFTLKKAANYLAGRPVYMAFTDKEANQYEAWAKRKFNVTKGEFEMGKYRKEYPFDMQNAVKNYSIKDLTVPEHETRLYEAYKRGNLQLATFVGSGGKEEQLYTSLNIGLINGGSLDVYDLNKDKVPIQQLADKGYIGNELAQQLKERLQRGPDQHKENVNGETKKVEKPALESRPHKQKIS